VPNSRVLIWNKSSLMKNMDKDSKDSSKRLKSGDFKLPTLSGQLLVPNLKMTFGMSCV